MAARCRPDTGCTAYRMMNCLTAKLITYILDMYVGCAAGKEWRTAMRVQKLGSPFSNTCDVCFTTIKSERKTRHEL
jgi:hypothetical protein